MINIEFFEVFDYLHIEFILKPGRFIPMSKNPSLSKDNIGQIRDLIFGAQMDEYQQKFETLEKEIDRVRQQMSASFEELKKSLESLKTQNENSHQKLSEQIGGSEAKLEKHLRATERQLIEMLDQLGSETITKRQLGDLFAEVVARLHDGHEVEILKDQRGIVKDE